MVATTVHVNRHLERCSLLEYNEMTDTLQQGVGGSPTPYPPPVSLHFVTRWDLSWLEMTQHGMKGSPGVGGFFSQY